MTDTLTKTAGLAALLEARLIDWEQARNAIYSIRNTINGKRYVGSAVILSRRFAQHRSNLRFGRHDSIKLQRAWDKNGADAFVFEVIELVDDASQLLAREQHWIDFYDAAHPVRGYNVLTVAGSSIGYRHTDEARAKMRREFSAEHRAKIAANNMGRVTSDETKKKLSAASKGRKLTGDHIEKLKKAMGGRKCKPRTPEHIARHAASLRATLAAKRAAKFEAAQA